MVVKNPYLKYLSFFIFCLLLTGIFLYFLKLKVKDSDVFVPDSPNNNQVSERLSNLLSTQDPAFMQMNKDVDSWKYYTSKDLMLSFSYPKDLVLQEGLNGDGLPVVSLTYPTDKDFELSIGLVGYGGGSLCANNYCYSVLDYVSFLEPITPQTPYTNEYSVDERLRNIDSSYIELELKLFLQDNNTEYIRLSSKYSSNQQREVIRKIISSLNINEN